MIKLSITECLNSKTEIEAFASYCKEIYILIDNLCFKSSPLPAVLSHGKIYLLVIWKDIYLLFLVLNVIDHDMSAPESKALRTMTGINTKLSLFCMLVYIADDRKVTKSCQP